MRQLEDPEPEEWVKYDERIQTLCDSSYSTTEDVVEFLKIVANELFSLILS